MGVKVDRSVRAWLRDVPGGGTLLVRTRDPDAAARALDNARADIEREIDPHYFTNALPTPAGPFLWIDAGDHGLDLLPEILTEHLLREGVDDAVITVPPKGGTLGDERTGLGSAQRGVVLSLYPVPRRRVYDEPPADIPPAWLAAAADWVRADLDPDAPAMTLTEGGPEFPLPVGATAAFLERARAARPLYSAVVVGDLGSRARGSTGCFHSQVPHLVLGAGGPACTDDDLVAIAGALAEVARPLAADVGYACIAVVPSLGLLSVHRPGSDWDRAAGGEEPRHLETVCDEYVFDAFPWQVLGPAHLDRLGGPPPAATPLANGRVELAIGEPVDWLLRSYEPQVWGDLAAHRHNPGIQAAGREMLAPCLLRRGEANEIKWARGRRAPAEAHEAQRSQGGMTREDDQ